MTELQRVVYQVLQQSAIPMQVKDVYTAVKAMAPQRWRKLGELTRAL